jgi:hypothetical protein
VQLPWYVTAGAAIVATLTVALLGCYKPSIGPAILPYYGFEIIDLNGDGVDDIVGANPNSMAVVDGKTFKARMLGIKPPQTWRLINGNIVTTGRETPRVLHVIELASGAVRKTFQLTDNVTSLQVPSSDRAAAVASTVIVKLLDQHVYRLDLTTLQLVEQLPQVEVQPKYQPIFCTSTQAACSWDDQMSGSPNIATLTHGNNRVSVRIKQPGTRELSVVCFDSNGNPRAPVLIDAKGYGINGIDLADGHLFVSYGGDVKAYDAATCDPQWQRQQLAAEVLQAQRGRLYVTTTGIRNYPKKLIVLDAATGILVGAP